MRSTLLLFAFFALLSGLLCQRASAQDTVADRLKFLAGPREPVTVQADVVKYDRKTNVYTASGNVIISQGTTTLTADRATLNLATGDAEASGKARLVAEDKVLFADSMKVNFNTKAGVIERGNIFVQNKNYHITGETMEGLGDDEYMVEHGTMTTCDGDSPAWKLSAGHLHLRMGKDVEATNVVLKVKGVPVFYSPYAWFPLLKPRTSGFLLPSFGYSTKQGIRILESFYWAPVDNFDATFTVDFRSRRGIGAGTDIRYALSRDWSGELQGYYFDDDQEGHRHYRVLFRNSQSITDAVSLKADVNLSDPFFYRNLTDTALERTQRSVDSNLFVTGRAEWGLGYLFGQYTRHTDVSLNQQVTVQRVPELGVNVSRKRINNSPFYLDLDASTAYFTEIVGVSGVRYDLFPKVTGEFNIGGINISPRVGYRETAYTLAGAGKDQFDKERGLFGAGVSAQTGLTKLYKFASGALEGIRHTIEPAVAYNYVLQRGGTFFPKYDGLDTLGRRDLIAYSLTNRFVIKYRGGATPRVDYFALKLGQYYDFFGSSRFLDVQRNPQGGIVSQDIVEEKRALSPIFGEMVYKAGKRLTLTNDFRYDINTGKLLSVNTDVRVTGSDGLWRLGLGQRYSLDAGQTFMSPSRFEFFTQNTDFTSQFITRTVTDKKLNFLTFDAGVKIGTHWDVKGLLWYDVHNKNLRENGVTATYTSQCWGVSANYVKRPGEKQVMVLVTLKGLGTVKI